jgi:hypothetical protein
MAFILKEGTNFWKTDHVSGEFCDHQWLKLTPSCRKRTAGIGQLDQHSSYTKNSTQISSSRRSAHNPLLREKNETKRLRCAFDCTAGGGLGWVSRK